MKKLLFTLCITFVLSVSAFAQSPYTLFGPTCPAVMPATQCCYDTDTFTLSCGTGTGTLIFPGLSTIGTPSMLSRFATGGLNLQNSTLFNDPVTGNIGLRTTAPSSGLHMLNGTAPEGNSSITLDVANESLSGPVLFLRKSRGSHSTPTYPQLNDIAGATQFYAWARDATNTTDTWVNIGQIRSAVESLDAESRVGGRVEITLSSGVSASPLIKFRVTANGSVMMGNTITGSPTADLDIFGQTLRVRTAKTPATATEACSAGTIVWDTGFVYVCTATNTWKRAALVTW